MSKSFLDDFYDILFNYRKGIPRIAEQRNIWQGLLVYLVVTVVVSLATFETAPLANSGEYLPAELAVFLPPQALEAAVKLFPHFTVLLQLVFGPLYFLLMVAVLHFISVLFKSEGKGSATGLGAVMGFAYFPYLLVAVGGLLDRYTLFNVIAVFTIGAYLWSLWLRIAGLKAVYGFSWGRAVLVYFLPLLLVLAAVIVFILLSIVFLVPLIIQIWENYIH